MSTYDTRLDALETEVAMMKRDIVYKLDDTNSSVTIIRGVMGVQGRDLRFVINQLRGLDIRLEGVEQDVRAIKEVQDAQGRDIIELKQSFVALNGRMDTLDGRMNALDGRMDSLESRIDSLEKNVNARFDILEKKFDQILQLLTPPSSTNQ